MKTLNNIELKLTDVQHFHEEIYGVECSMEYAEDILRRFYFLKSFNPSYSIYAYMKKIGPEIEVLEKPEYLEENFA